MCKSQSPTKALVPLSGGGRSGADCSLIERASITARWGAPYGCTATSSFTLIVGPAFCIEP